MIFFSFFVCCSVPEGLYFFFLFDSLSKKRIRSCGLQLLRTDDCHCDALCCRHKLLKVCSSLLDKVARHRHVDGTDAKTRTHQPTPRRPMIPTDANQSQACYIRQILLVTRRHRNIGQKVSTTTLTAHGHLRENTKINQRGGDPAEPTTEPPRLVRLVLLWRCMCGVPGAQTNDERFKARKARLPLVEEELTPVHRETLQPDRHCRQRESPSRIHLNCFQ